MDDTTASPPRDAPSRMIGTFYGAFGTLFATLSIVKLIEHGVASRFSDTLTRLLERYESLTSLLFGWAEPLIAAKLHALFNWNIALQPHWKHVLVLLALYFSRNVAVTWRARGPATAIVRAAWAGVVAATTSIGVGILPVAAQDLSANFLLAFLPLVGVTLFDLGNDAWGGIWFRAPGQSWSDHFRFEARYVLARAAAGTILILGALQLPAVANTASPGLVVLGLLVGVLALYWIWLGTTLPARNRSGDTWRATTGRKGAWQLGLSMLACILGAALFVAVDTGAKFLP